jgi:DNA-binding transcriptional LysR family regulator
MDLKHLTTNIGPELLRTFLAIVDTRSFTKTAAALGISQPTVSGHIKRLQEQLGSDLLDRSVPGVRLTEQGEIVASYARQILAAHDELFDRLERGRSPTARLRIGVPYELQCSAIVPALADFCSRYPHVEFDIRRDVSDTLLRLVHLSQLDMAVAMTMFEPGVKSLSHWREPMTWVSIPNTIAAQNPLPVIAHSPGSVSREIMTSALAEAGIDYQIVISAEHVSGIVAGVTAGLGFSVLPRSQVMRPLAEVSPILGLPKLREAFWGVYLADAARSETAEALATLIGDVVKGKRPEASEAAL